MWVDDELAFEPVAGVRFFRTRRPFDLLQHPRNGIPVANLEAAVLMTAAYELQPRAGHGLLAAAVQQRLTTASRLLSGGSSSSGRYAGAESLRAVLATSPTAHTPEPSSTWCGPVPTSRPAGAPTGSAPAGWTTVRVARAGPTRSGISPTAPRS